MFRRLAHDVPVGDGFAALTIAVGTFLLYCDIGHKSPLTYFWVPTLLRSRAVSTSKTTTERRNRLIRYRRTAENGGVAPTDKHDQSTYSGWNCRCPICTADHAAKRKAQAAERRRLTAANGGIAPVKRHNANTYRAWRCRCVPCCEAWAKRRARKALG